MKSAIKHSAENNLHLRVMTAKAKIIARAEAIAREFAEEYPEATTDFNAYFIAEAEAKANAKTEKESTADYVPSWMSATRWTTGERRTAAKLKMYGYKRILRADGYHKDPNAYEEHRPYNKEAPRHSLTKEDRRTA